MAPVLCLLFEVEVVVLELDDWLEVDIPVAAVVVGGELVTGGVVNGEGFEGVGVGVAD